MQNIKVVFFDIKEIEQDFILKNKPENCDFIIIKNTIQDGFEAHYEEIKDAEIISVFTTSRFKASILEKFPNLKFITCRSTGFSHIDLDYCHKHNITVTNVPRYGDCTVAEYAFGLLLSVTRRINKAHNNLRRGIIDLEGNIGNDLFEKTIGIIGTGAIGCHAIRIANGFGMNILCYDPYPKADLKEKYNVKYVGLDELYANSDIISLHAPSTKENFHMINEEAFNKMKKGVVIINTARGEIMDTEALYKSIKSGIVAGAGLDVLECEDILAKEGEYLTKIDCIDVECLSKTLINHRLLETPNVIITPHVAFDTQEAVYRILSTTINNINGYLIGNIQNKVG